MLTRAQAVTRMITAIMSHLRIGFVIVDRKVGYTQRISVSPVVMLKIAPSRGHRCDIIKCVYYVVELAGILSDACGNYSRAEVFVESSRVTEAQRP